MLDLESEQVDAVVVLVAFTVGGAVEARRFSLGCIICLKWQFFLGCRWYCCWRVAILSDCGWAERIGQQFERKRRGRRSGCGCLGWVLLYWDVIKVVLLEYEIL